MGYEIKDYEEAYRDIVELYDIAEALINTVEDPRARFQDKQIDILEELVDEVVECSDELSEQFCEFAEAENKPKAAKKFKFRPVFKRMFKAVNHSLDRIYKQPAEVAENITTVILPTFEKLVKHTEHVFGKLASIVGQVKDVVTRRREFRDMVMREAHLATIMHSKLSPDGPGQH